MWIGGGQRLQMIGPTTGALRNIGGLPGAFVAYIMKVLLKSDI